MIGHLDEAMAQAVADARAGERHEPAAGDGRGAYLRAWRRTRRNMNRLGKLPQLRLALQADRAPDADSPCTGD